MRDLAMIQTQPLLPVLIANAGEKAQKRFLEFFLVSIRNKNTRDAYGFAVGAFLRWCEERGLTLASIEPLMVAAYIERHSGSPATINQHLAAIRKLFDYLVTGQIMPFNPASSVKGPKERITTGKTPVLTGQEAAMLFATCDVATPTGLRDQALFRVMLYTTSRISALLNAKRGDYVKRSGRAFLRQHEKGGVYREVPLHHQAEQALDRYLEVAAIKDPKAFLFQPTAQDRKSLMNRKLSRFSALERVKIAAAKAGLNPDACNHTFKATGITLYRKAGGSLENARKMAAHSSAETTRLYDRSDQELTQVEVERIVV